MPVTAERAINKIGDSFMVVINPGWVRWLEEQTGRSYKEIKLKTLTNTVIIVSPPAEVKTSYPQEKTGNGDQ